MQLDPKDPPHDMHSMQTWSSPGKPWHQPSFLHIGYIAVHVHAEAGPQSAARSTHGVHRVSNKAEPDALRLCIDDCDTPAPDAMSAEKGRYKTLECAAPGLMSRLSLPVQHHV